MIEAHLSCSSKVRVVILALVNFVFFLDLVWYNLLLVLVTEMSFFGSLLYLILINLTISTYRKEE